MKRFTDTDKWSDSHLKRLASSHTPYFLLYLYMLDLADKAGFFNPELDVFTMRTGQHVKASTAIDLLKPFVHAHNNGPWQIKDFFPAQYPDQTEDCCNNMTKSAIKCLAGWSQKLGPDTFFIAGLRRRPSADQQTVVVAAQDGIPGSGMPRGDGGVAVDGGGAGGEMLPEIEMGGGESARGGGPQAEADMQEAAQVAGVEWPRHSQKARKSLQAAFKRHGVDLVPSGWRIYLERFKGQRSLQNFLEPRYLGTWIEHAEARRTVAAASCTHQAGRYVKSWRTLEPDFPAGLRENKYHCKGCDKFLETLAEIPPCEHDNNPTWWASRSINVAAGAMRQILQCQQCGTVKADPAAQVAA